MNLVLSFLASLFYLLGCSNKSAITLPTYNVKAVGVGTNHTCFLSDNSVQCVGENSASNKLGDGETSDSTSLIQAKGLNARTTSLAVGLEHSCSYTNQEVRCWGSNSSSALGLASKVRTVPTVTSGISIATSDGLGEMVAGANFTCITVVGSSSPRVACFGGLGGAGGTSYVTSSSTTVVTDIAAGSDHACAVVNSGVKCWGTNTYGQLGDESTTTTGTPIDVSTLGPRSEVSMVAAGNGHSCAVVDGAAKCWGLNDSGQLGDGTTTNRSKPTTVSGLSSGVKAIYAGNKMTCALTESAGLFCWGLNSQGQLGNNSTTTATTPSAVSGLGSTDEIISVAPAMDSHSCAALSSGFVCWGDNSKGQLGDGTTTDRLTPTTVSGF